MHDEIFLAGLVYFVIAPAVEEPSLRSAMFRGAAFGLVTYATWDLTSLAVIEGFLLAESDTCLVIDGDLRHTSGEVIYLHKTL